MDKKGLERVMIFIVPPNFYIVSEMASPPLQFEPFYNYGDFEIVHLKRGQSLDAIPDSDFYGITSYSEDYPMSEIIARFLKQRNPGCRIAIGGSHPTYRPELINKTLFDNIIVGNGEDFVKNPRLFLDKYTCMYHNTRWDSRSFRHFVEYNPNYHRGTECSYTLRTTFGCYWDCDFCANSQKRYRVQFRELEDIRNQLQYLSDNGMTNIRVIDETFTLHPHYKDISNMLKAFSWNAQDRIDRLTPQNCKILSDNGCKLIQVGIESLDQSIREKLNKKLTQEKIEEGVKYAKDNEITLNAFIMLGTPYDSYDSINLTCDKGVEIFGNNLRPDIFVPLPGTKIGNNLNNLRILETDFKYYSPFPFQNTYGKLVFVPQHIKDISRWSQFLWDKLYQLSPPIIRNVLDNPIKDWFTDYE